jgi:hypothetical protein
MKLNPMWSWVGLGLLTCTACLDPKPALPGPDPDQAPRALQIRDRAGAEWPMDAMPRAPRLLLSFDDLPRHPETQLWMTQGAASDDALEDLSDPPLRASTKEKLVMLSITSADGHVEAAPAVPLEPGQGYTLIWLRHGAEPVQYALEVSQSPAAGAELRESWPADRDRHVPANARELLLRFDGYVRNLDRTRLGLRDASGRALPFTLQVSACADLGLPAGDCATLQPAPLAAQANYTLALLSGLEDATGAPIAARTLSFGTVAADATPVLTLTVACASDEIAYPVGCLLPGRDRITLRGMVDEPALITLRHGDSTRASLALSASFVLTLPAAPNARLATLVLENLAGMRTAQALRIDPTPALASVHIDELRPDPLGPEPAQEYVELSNDGSAAVQIMGFSLTDNAFEPGVSIETSLELAAGERVLAVAPEFELSDTSDGDLPAGVRIVRLSKALALANSGTALFLRDALGHRLDEVPRVAPDQPGQCIARIGETFMPDPSGGCTPGEPSEVSARGPGPLARSPLSVFEAP